jgi:hypothetical protein
MSLAETSSLNDNAVDDGEERQLVFVRVINTPPGAPWDQSRQAALEARLGAPSRMTDVVCRVRRLESWRPARPARFAAVYARAEDIRDGLRATPTIDGRPILISFMPPAAQARRLRNVSVIAAAATISFALLLLLAITAASRRSQTGELLNQTEAMSSARLTQANRVETRESESRVLDRLNLRHQRLSEVIAEIAWASSARSPSAHVQALHWDHGFLALEADGDSPPIDKLAQPMQRSRAPVRPGVWLWGLSSTEPWTVGLENLAGQSPDPGRKR